MPSNNNNIYDGVYSVSSQTATAWAKEENLYDTREENITMTMTKEDGIPIAEFITALSEIDPNYPYYDELAKEIDSDNDGYVVLREFCKMAVQTKKLNSFLDKFETRKSKQEDISTTVFLRYF